MAAKNKVSDSGIVDLGDVGTEEATEALVAKFDLKALTHIVGLTGKGSVIKTGELFNCEDPVEKKRLLGLGAAKVPDEPVKKVKTISPE